MRAYLIGLSLALGMSSCFAETSIGCSADTPASTETPAATEQTYKPGEDVSLTNLVATPERYEGVLVSVPGYVTVGFEHMSLCPSKNPLSQKDCVWLSVDEGPFESEADMARFFKKVALLKKFNGKRAFVRGVFDSTHLGHFSMWSGSIKPIIDVRSEKFDITVNFENTLPNRPGD